MNIRVLGFLLVPFVATGAEMKLAGNIVGNPSFEEDRDRDGLPDGWQSFAYESPSKLGWDESVGRTGTRSLRIADSARPGDEKDWKRCCGRWVGARRPVVPGTEYTLEVWVRTKDVTGRASAHIAWQKGGSWLGENATAGLSGSGDWRRLAVTAQAPAQADCLVVSMNLARSRGTAWFDDVTVSGRSDELPRIEYAFRETKDWFPFTFPLDDTNLDGIDLSGYLDAPAGKHGFMAARPDGHFQFSNGRRARFFGTNVGGRDAFPDKDRAPILAARLAKYGINMLRLHSLDGRSNPLIDGSKGTSREFDPAALDRLDFFIAELKKRGIYVYLDLLDYRWFRTADGVAHGDEFDHNWKGSMKGASIFDERMIELQKDYATRLLTHRNPYTGLRYADDAAIAVIETTNENSIFYFFRNADLSLPYYRDELSRRWNAWLRSRHADRAALAKAWTDTAGACALGAGEDPAKDTVAFPFGSVRRLTEVLEGRRSDPLLAAIRVGDVLRFLCEVQTRYYAEMRAHLKKLGVRAPIAGTNQTFFNADTAVDAAGNDFMSRNQYWRHPDVKALPFPRFSNDPLLRVNLRKERNPLSVIASTSVAGKPQAVAEFNFPWPNEFRAEGWLMSTAYACLQDWDIFLFFVYSPDETTLATFGGQSDPARWGEVPAAAALYHRQDVARGRNEVHVLCPPEALYAPRPDTTDARTSEFNFLPFISKVRTAFPDGAYTGGADVALACGPARNARVAGEAKVIRLDGEGWRDWLMPQFVEAARALKLPGYDRVATGGDRFDSDTGELALDHGKGLFTVRTPRSRAAVGFLGEAGPVDLDGLRVECATDFAAVSATSLDGEPIGRSRRVLLTAVGRAENSHQAYWPPTAEQLARNRSSWMLPTAGRLPVIVEPVRAVVTLPMPGPAVVRSLDPSGKRVARIASTSAGGLLRIDLAAARSIWCEVVVE